TVAVVDTALFGQNFALAAESMGYGICYIGGVRNNPKQISELFNLPEHVIPLFGMTVGVPVKLNEVKPRYLLKRLYKKTVMIKKNIMSNYIHTTKLQDLIIKNVRIIVKILPGVRRCVIICRLKNVHIYWSLYNHKDI